KLGKLVIAGHSVAGSELSAIASRHPDRVAGLIYLDAGYPYAFYNAERGDWMPPPPPGMHLPPVQQAIAEGAQKFTNLNSVPILAIYALPHALPGPPDDPSRAARQAADVESTGAQAAAFEKGVPSARVVRLPNADHSVWRSNEADVLREMNAFLTTLK